MKLRIEIERVNTKSWEVPGYLSAILLCRVITYRPGIGCSYRYLAKGLQSCLLPCY